MNEHDAFLQSVLADPDDDGPRLIYADWLEEHGDVRGEFIRLQCELAAMPPNRRCKTGKGECSPRSKCPECGLRRREQELLGEHRAAWTAPLVAFLPDLLHGREDAPLLVPRLTEAMVATAHFRRGFVQRVELTLSWYALVADRLHATTPLRELVLMGAREVRREEIRDTCAGRGLRRLFLRYPLSFMRLIVGRVWLDGVRSELPDVEVVAIGTKESPDDA